MNSILQVKQSLKNHSTKTKEFNCTNLNGNNDKIFLLFVPWSEDGICETNEARPRSWKRVGSQNLIHTEQDREQLKRDKRLGHFEISFCCVYDSSELDTGVVEEFKKCFINSRGARYDYSTEDILFQAGALIKDNDKYAFTKSGVTSQKVEVIAFCRINCSNCGMAFNLPVLSLR